MIRWLFVAFGALIVYGACAPGARIVHGRGAGRRSRPVRPVERALIAAVGLFLIWLMLRRYL